MRNLLAILLFGIIISACNKDNDTRFSVKTANNLLKISELHYLNMTNELKDSVLPRTFENDKIVTSGTKWWTSGFFPGSLWYLYEVSGNEALKDEAEKRTELIEKEKDNKRTHDLGFMMYCSFGNGYRLTGNPKYKDVMIEGANSLTSRFDSTVGCIRSWNHGDWQFPVIIDNMMNLEFLFWATKQTSDSIYYKISTTHADNTIKNHYRDDFSCFHVVDYDTLTGEVLNKETHQGFSNESAWARGQAWGLYGYTMCYRETGDKTYLNQAVNISDFLLNHPNMPEDKIPYWDFNDPNIPNSLRDVSSASIIASALIELSDYVDEQKKAEMINAAEQILYSLSTDVYLATPGTNGNFILKHSVGSLPNNSEMDVPLTYADYYFIEALIRYLNVN